MQKVPKAYKEFVKKCAQQAAWHIGVSHYEIDIHYMAEEKEKGDLILKGEMTTDRRYLQGTLRLYPSVEEHWNKGEKEEVKKVVFHEIAHLATQHLYDVATATYRDEGEMKDAWETLTEVIGRMARVIDKSNAK